MDLSATKCAQCRIRKVAEHGVDAKSGKLSIFGFRVTSVIG